MGASIRSIFIVVLLSTLLFVIVPLVFWLVYENLQESIVDFPDVFVAQTAFSRYNEGNNK